MAYNDKYRLSAHAVITNGDNHILLLKQNYNKKNWGLPGGSIEPGETVHQALIRECQEEIGCEIEVEYLSGVYYHAEHEAHVFIFRVKIDSAAQIKLDDEHSEYSYFDPKDKSISRVQRRRIYECLNHDGTLKSASFL